MGRILYTLDHKTIVSKDRGLQYLSERSAEEWGLLLKEVARIRHNQKEKRMLSRWRRADMTKRYLLHLIETCRENGREENGQYSGGIVFFILVDRKESIYKYCVEER